MKAEDLAGINPSLTAERRDAILAGCRAWIADYNGRAKADYQFAAERAHLAVDLAARCLRAGLNPLEERITARPQYDKKAGAWGLVFIAEIETLLSRASQTGRYVSHRTYTRIREDKRLLAVAEVAHLYTPPASTGLAPSIVVSSDEGDIGEWKAMVGGASSFWSSNPTHMAELAVLRATLKRIFPDLLSGEGEVDGDDGANGDDSQAAPTPAQQNAAREAATSPAGATPTQAAGAARAALNGERQKAREPAPAEPPAPAPDPAPPAPLAAAPAPTTQAAPSDRHADLLECAPGGFTAGDLEELAQGGFRCDVASLSEAQLTQLRSEILPRGPVTVRVRADVVARREAFLTAGGDAAGWLAHCRAVARPDFRWHPTWLWADDAAKILAADAPARAA